MTFTQGRPNIDGAARGDPEKRLLYQSFHTRIAEIEKKIGLQAVDPDTQNPVAPLPPLAQVSITAGSGRFIIKITNPQYIFTTKVIAARNQIRTPIEHLLECSLNTQFDGGGDVHSFGPSSQTYWEITSLGVSKRFWRVKSTFDGENFNKPILKGPVQS
jgi:hypothetical protein